MKMKLRPHKVLGRSTPQGELHALCLTSGPFANIVFSYNTVDFKENDSQDHLTISFDYDVHYVPEDKLEFDRSAFERELGDFVVELLMYGVEKENLGFINDNENGKDNTIQPDSQRGVLS